MSDYDTDYSDEFDDEYNDSNIIVEEDNNDKCNCETCMTANNMKDIDFLVEKILCDICNKFYSEKLVDMSDQSFIKCLHCHFFFKYDEFKKDSVIDSEAEKLLEYFKMCSDNHDKKKCKTEKEQCLLCEYKDGIVPKSVKRILEKNIKKDSNNNSKTFNNVTICCNKKFTDTIELVNTITIKI